MIPLDCGHATGRLGATTCTHLLAALEPGATYNEWFTGVGLDKHLVCSTCLERLVEGQQVRIVSICVQCRASLVEVADFGRLLGRPEVLERPGEVDSLIEETPIPQPVRSVLDLAPVPRVDGAWMLLTGGGHLTRWCPEFGQLEDLGVVNVPSDIEYGPFAGHGVTPRLHVSSTGEYVAVVNDYGEHGVVYDAKAGRITLTLDGGDNCSYTVPFSFAFVEHRRRTVAIHRTAWNRLDASDAATGSLLTDRILPGYRPGEPAEHHLDYFHGRLVVNPGGTRVVDDGWVWHPVGIPCVWSISAWLESNVWESEDGMSRFDLAAREAYWDHALCWIDDDRVALGGLGDDADFIVPGVRVLDSVGTAPRHRWRIRPVPEIRSFAGPGDTIFSDGVRLFSVDGAGLSIWDIQDGARVGRVRDFHPTRQHPLSRELLELDGTMIRRWRY